MKALEFKKLLTKLGACQSAISWTKEKDLKTAWETCERGDWLLWLVGNQVGELNWPTTQQVVLAACACAETALKYVSKDELRPKQAIDVTKQWANGKCTIEEVRNAASAASSAVRAVETGPSKAYLAASLAKSVAYLASAEFLAEEASHSARAAAYLAKDRKEIADIVRRELTQYMKEVL